MLNILVLGGGFAGVWSAASAVRAARESGVPASELRVTLVSDGDDMVIRPRLYERDPAQMRVSLDRVLGPIGVDRVAATVIGIDTSARTVEALSSEGQTIALPYDRLVLATGSRVLQPNVPGTRFLFDVDTIAAADTLERHLSKLADQPDRDGIFSAVVIGAGFTGLEVATELAGRLSELAGSDPRRERVVLVDRSQNVGQQLGDGPRPQIIAALDELGVVVRLGTTVAEVTESHVRLSDGEVIAASTTVWTAGMLASPLTEEVPGERDPLGRLIVDEYLRVPTAPDVYAAGDTAAAVAEDGHFVMQSCQHAVPLGKFAGYNAAADLLGLPQAPFATNPYATCLDLGAAGAVATNGWQREVQMTGEEAKALKRQINAEWIYPPLDDAEAILHLADHQQTWPPVEIFDQPLAAQR
jgi:NADH:ubiquinone reductase (H+-translocating)